MKGDGDMKGGMKGAVKAGRGSELAGLFLGADIEEKIRLCAGRSFWTLGGIERLRIPPISVCDGSSGVRVNSRDEGYERGNKSLPSVCYPSEAAIACSFDPSLVYEVARATGEEARAAGIDIVLAPGMNIKRNPLGGRNFEYFSEDPYLTGRLAAAYVRGLQSVGAGACLKHFAVNSQERFRKIADARVSERALWDIYLKAFGMVIADSDPWAVMAAYNKLNGVYCCENRWLLHDVLRIQMGFKGITVSDWGAMDRAVESFNAGLDVEMPGNVNKDEGYILSQVRQGRIPLRRINEISARFLRLYARRARARRIPWESRQELHLKTAERASCCSCVLLRNEGGLPLKRSDKIALIGIFAQKPRYQGSGSSRVNAVSVDNCLEELKKRGCKSLEYAVGFTASGVHNPDLLSEAMEAGARADRIVVFAGIPQEQESEGYDRESLKLPGVQNSLIERLCGLGKKVIVVIQAGGPVEMPWASRVDGILMTYLGGCRSGAAAAALLLGDENPSGKLSETFPVKVEDTPGVECYKRDCRSRRSIYSEGVLVGYRYYDVLGKEVLFPFGHGLSYTTFAYSSPVRRDGRIYFRLKNEGGCFGREAAQLYIRRRGSKYRELKGFKKVGLKSGEEREISIRLSEMDFARYDAGEEGYVAKKGEYIIEIGSSSADIRLTLPVRVRETVVFPLKISPTGYGYAADGGADRASGAGAVKKRGFRNTTIRDLYRIPILRPLIHLVLHSAVKGTEEFIVEEKLKKVIIDEPLRGIPLALGGIAGRLIVKLLGQ